MESPRGHERSDLVVLRQHGKCPLKRHVVMGAIWVLVHHKRWYSHTQNERRVPELITVLGSQPAGDRSHKPGGRLSLLSAKPVVTSPQPPSITAHWSVPNYTAW